MPCGGKFENFSCTKHCFGNQCGFKRTYLEGSGLSGVVYQDYIGVVAPQEIQTGNSATKPLINTPKVHTFPRALGLFGCTTLESGLFKTQLANGIMGLADDTDTIKTSPNFIDTLFKSRESNTKNFSLCLGTNGGFLTFGGYNASKHLPNESIQTVIYKENY